jgi:DNA replicative helicase MCM subunit Mcm2 (Cdc46/Mcm family)
MTSITHTCENCDSAFTIKYDEEQTDTDPGFCPFCGEMMIDYDFDDEDKDEEDV